MSTAYLTSVLDNTVSNGNFASLLSTNSGNPGLSVRGTFVAVATSPTEAPFIRTGAPAVSTGSGEAL